MTKGEIVKEFPKTSHKYDVIYEIIEREEGDESW